jgi:NAD(P)-dependent dehydrogenase (short-subunit alcohol dehydrogenase family)
VAAEVDGVGTVVAPVLPGRTGPKVRRALADLPEDEWVTECELPMRAARFAVQAAFTTFAGEGGRVVLVAPTAALTGEPGLAAYSTAAEASRAMVRAVARGWGAHGITLHWVGAPTALFTGEDPSSAPRMAMWDHALGGPATIDDVAAVVWSLATPTTAALTGTTTIVDGGLVMPV